MQRFSEKNVSVPERRERSKSVVSAMSRRSVRFSIGSTNTVYNRLQRRQHVVNIPYIPWFFHDDRPIQEEIMFFRIEGINLSVSHNPSNSPKPHAPRSRRRSVIDFAWLLTRNSEDLDDMKERLSETKHRANFLTKALGRYQDQVKHDSKRNSEEPVNVNLEKEIGMLDKMMENEGFLTDDTKQKKARVRFLSRHRAMSLYETIVENSQKKENQWMDILKPGTDDKEQEGKRRSIMSVKLIPRRSGVQEGKNRESSGSTSTYYSLPDETQSFHSVHDITDTVYHNLQRDRSEKDKDVNQNADTDNCSPVQPCASPAIKNLNVEGEVVDEDKLIRKLKAKIHLMNKKISRLKKENAALKFQKNRVEREEALYQIPLPNPACPWPNLVSHPVRPSLVRLSIYIVAHIFGMFITKVFL